jgi:hypothetical protein
MRGRAQSLKPVPGAIFSLSAMSLLASALRRAVRPAASAVLRSFHASAPARITYDEWIQAKPHCHHQSLWKEYKPVGPSGSVSSLSSPSRHRPSSLRCPSCGSCEELPHLNVSARAFSRFSVQWPERQGGRRWRSGGGSPIEMERLLLAGKVLALMVAPNVLACPARAHGHPPCVARPQPAGSRQATPETPPSLPPSSPLPPPIRPKPQRGSNTQPC